MTEMSGIVAADINAANGTMVNCHQSNIELFIENADPQLEYVWMVNNETVESPTLIVEQAAQVILMTFDPITNCEAFDTIQIDADFAAPQFTLPQGQMLNCDQQVINLVPNVSANGYQVEYQWMDQNGNIMGTDSLMEVSTAGQYTLEAVSYTHLTLPTKRIV